MTACNIVLSIEEFFDLVPNQEEQVMLTIDGLVSDNAIVELSGQTMTVVTTSPSLLESFRNVHTRSEGIALQIKTENMSLNLTAHLKAIWSLHTDTSGRLMSMRSVYASDQEWAMQTAPATMTLVVLAMMSDWVDETMSDLADMTMQDMIYTEVE